MANCAKCVWVDPETRVICSNSPTTLVIMNKEPVHVAADLCEEHKVQYATRRKVINERAAKQRTSTVKRRGNSQL